MEQTRCPVPQFCDYLCAVAHHEISEHTDRNSQFINEWFRNAEAVDVAAPETNKPIKVLLGGEWTRVECIGRR